MSENSKGNSSSKHCLFLLIGLFLLGYLYCQKVNAADLETSIPPTVRAVKKGNTALLQEIESGFTQLSDEELQQIDKKWHGESFLSFVSVKYLLVITGVPFFLILVLFYWNRSLSKAVKNRTSELEISEKELRKSAAQYRDLVENANSIILRMDSNGRISFFNEFAQRFFGYQASEVIGKSVVGTIVPETDTEGKNLQAMIADIGRRTDRYATNENENMRRDGTRVWISWTNKPFYNTVNEVSEILCVGNDITERKRAEDALKENDARFRSLFKSAPIPLAIANPDGTVNEVNDCLVKVIGYTPEDIPDLDHWWAIAYPDPAPDCWNRVQSTWKNAARQAIATGTKLEPEEYRVTCKDGRVLRMIIGSNKIGDSYIVSMFDVTTLREKEAALQESMELLRATFNATNDGILAVNKDLKVTQANRQFYAMWNIPPDLPNIDDDASLRQFVLNQLADPVGFSDMVDGLYRSQRQDIHEIPLKNGRVFECYTAPMLMAGQEIGRVWDFRDISARKKTEDAIDFERRQLLSIFDCSYEIIYVADPVTHEVIFANRRLRELLGKDPTGEVCYQVLQGANQPCDFCSNPISLKSNGQPHKWDQHNTFGIDLEMVDQIIRWPDGRDVRLVIARDITEQKQAKEALVHSEKKLRSIFAAMCDAVLILDAEGRYIEIAPTNTSLLYRPIEALIGKTLKEIFPPEKTALFMDAIGAVVSQNKSVSLDYELNFDDRNVWFSATVSPMSPNRVICVARDITNRKQAEAELRRSEEKFSKIFAMVPDIIAITHMKDGKIINANNAFEEITGWNRSEVVGLTSSDIRFWADPSARADMVKELMAGRDVLHREMEFRHKDGTVRRGLYSARVISLSDELSFLFVLQDITENKKLEAERQKLQDQLLQAQKMEAIGTLAGGIAHDFNNMLGAIIGYAQLSLVTMDTGHPLRNNISQILNAANRSAGLTRQLLAFARKQTIAPVVFDINGAIEELLKMLRRLIGENIDLIWLPGPSPCNVKLDPSQLDQILANLCVNARDAIDSAGRVTIETDVVTFDEAACYAHPGCTPGEYVVLIVSDDGSGMEKSTLSRIFEPFFTTKAIGLGTGLGLATVYGIIQQNRGLVNVYSEPGKGTAFKVYFPRQTAETHVANATQSDVSISRGETILVVEDDLILLEMTTLMLKGLGYRVLSAGTPGEAFRLAEDNRKEIHLLLTDMVMPEMTGRELADKLHKIRPEIKHLFMSGYTSNVIDHQGVLDKGINFIQKPFSLYDLSVKLRTVLDQPLSF